MTVEERCVCCDLPLSMCGRAAEKRMKAALRVQRDRWLSLPGVRSAQYITQCICGEWIQVSDPIVRVDGEWQGVQCCGLEATG